MCQLYHWITMQMACARHLVLLVHLTQLMTSSTSTDTDHDSNVYTGGSHPIKVFTIHSLDGKLKPVDLDMSQLSRIQYPESLSQGSNDDQVTTASGNQTVHHCNGPPLIARGREHHRFLHSDFNVKDTGYNNSKILSLLQKHIKAFGHRRRYRRGARMFRNRGFGGSSNQNETRHQGTANQTETRQQEAQARAYVLETLLVCDYRLYQRFLTANSNQPAAALLSMVEYYSQVFRAVIRRYESAADAEFSITLQPTIIIIAQTAANSPFTENNLYSGERLSSGAALRDFTTYVNTLKDGGLAFDHAALMTGFDMYANNERFNLLGLAYMFGACGRDSTSLNEESFSEQTANTLAHEIGHNIGSGHDGDGNACQIGTFYLMAPTSALPTTPDLGPNAWKFSACSIASLKSFLNTNDASCTLSQESSNNININQYLTQEWGQVSNADQQCRRRYGAQSRFCRENYSTDNTLDFSDMCYNLKCYDPNRRACALIPAHDGTSCDNRKWCFKGVCTDSLQAPARFENCPQLDDPTRSCTPDACSDDNNRRIYCCNTCGQIAPPNIPSPSPPPPLPSSSSSPPAPSASPSPAPFPSPYPSRRLPLSALEIENIMAFRVRQDDPDDLWA